VTELTPPPTRKPDSKDDPQKKENDEGSFVGGFK